MRPHLSGLSWTSLRAFEAASRLGSFKEAARELGVTPTAISHQVKRLETYLGLGLFERLHRSLQLTGAGEALAIELEESFTRVHCALSRLRFDGQAAGPDTLSVSVVPSLATKWLVPKLHDFQAAHPRIGLRIVADEALVDLHRDRVVDVALRYGPGIHSKRIYARRLWQKGEIVAVCAPTLAKASPMRSPADVVRHVLIRTAAPASNLRSRPRPSSDWLTWLAAAGVTINGVIEKKLLEGPLFSASQLAIEAALAGKGVALVPAVLVQRDLAAERLVRPFRISIVDPNAFWILCRADRARESRIRAFIKWLSAEASTGEGSAVITPSPAR